MPVNPTYPGVYIEEIPSGLRTIVGVSTSVAAFVDFFPRGPLNKAVQIFSPADFERNFGGLDARSEASYAIQQFFLNGGTQAWVVRATTSAAGLGAHAAAIIVQDNTGADVLKITAAAPGGWGSNLRVEVDYGTTDPTKQFNLTVTEFRTVDGQLQPASSETFRNLVLDATQSNDAVQTVNNGSQLIKVELVGVNKRRPAQTGTVTGPLAAGSLPAGLAAGDAMTVTLSSGSAFAKTVTLPNPIPTSLSSLAAALQTQLRAVDKSIANATVTVAGSASSTAYLQFSPGTSKASDFLTFADATNTPASKLGLSAAGNINVQEYALGESAPAKFENAGSTVAGSDGGDATNPPIDAQGLIGDPLQKTGMQALQDVDIFNILCIPATMNLPAADAAAVASQAEALCRDNFAFYILDYPQTASGVDSVDFISHWLDTNGSLRSPYSALYFPRMRIPDPLNNFQLRTVAPSGTMAGLYARTDAERAVWKAPAGTDATLGNVQALTYNLTDGENGVLNPVAINCLRQFPIYGLVSWGARTLFGADQQESDWKYLSVRRFANFLEGTLYRGTQWVVFEPNDETLWAEIRKSVGGFMQTLFRQGAFPGTTPQTSYQVKCDADTNPPDQVDRGIVNIVVAFAPLKPAEFVVIQIQQMAGQTQS
jgi:phage tail sheath protein FI